MTWAVLLGDVIDRLREMPNASVQCVVTSPPYWGLRDYGVAGQIGLEPTPEAYTAKMAAVFREVRRILRDDGTLWLNLGDSYAADRGGACMPAETLAGGVGGKSDYADPLRGRQRHGNRQAHRDAPSIGLKHKDLVGIPWRVAFTLQADGWYLRSDIIWSKPNPMPESVTDRPTKAHEYLFLLTKSARYYFDQEAVKEPANPANYRANPSSREVAPGSSQQGKLDSRRGDVNCDNRNIRTVWTIATQPFPEAHFATFPEALVEPCIKAGSRQGDAILDPFAGSGTTGIVALKLGRSFVGIELNPEYREMARRRLGSVAPLLAEEAV